MTIAIALVSPHTAMVAADRRYSGVKPLSGFLGTKICRLETSDANGILTFAGAGAAHAAGQTLELSSWVERALSGINAPLDHVLNQIAKLATSEKLDRYQHTFIFAGFRDGAPVLEAVTSLEGLTVINGKGAPIDRHKVEGVGFRRVNVQVPKNGARIFVAGSGAPFLRRSHTRGVLPRISRKATDNSRMRAAALLAAAVRDISIRAPGVSPEAVCAWALNPSGGAHFAYDDKGRRVDTGVLPSLARGIPISELARHVFPLMMEHMEKLIAWDGNGSPPEHDDEKMREATAKIIMKPRPRFDPRT